MLPLAALKNKKNSDQKHWHPIASLLGSTRGYLSLSENTLIQDLNILHWHWNNLLQTYCCFFLFFNEKQTKPKQSIKSNGRPLETLSRQSWWPTPLAGFTYRAGIDLLYSWLSVLAATVLRSLFCHFLNGSADSSSWQNIIWGCLMIRSVWSMTMRLIYDYEVAIITSVAACCNSSFVLFPHKPYSHAVISSELIQLKASHPPIIIIFQLNCFSPRWSHKHYCSHNGKCANGTFTWHFNNQKCKVKLFPISKHTWNRVPLRFVKETSHPKGNNIQVRMY